MKTEAVGITGSLRAGEQLPAENEQDTAFLELLQKFDATQETPAERRARNAAEAKQAEEHRAKMKKMAELRSRIAQLQTKLAAQNTPAVAAELAMLQTELFWLMAV